MARRKSASLEQRLDAVSALRRETNPELVTSKLRDALGDRHNLMVARAAKVAGELGIEALADDLVAAFERLMADPGRLDKGAQAARAIVDALVALEVQAPRVFERGIRHVQMEAAYGGPIDVAIEVRANSAIGLASCGGPHVVAELTNLLVDDAEMVRLAAARAIGGAGRVDSEAVLRLKVLVGDEEPEVLVECLAGLLDLAPERSLELSRPLLEGGDPTLRQAAALALGESRLEAAVALLREHFHREVDREVRRSLLLGLAASRQDAAFDFLFALVAESHVGDAYPALDALVILLADPKMEERLEEALSQSPHERDLRRYLDSRR